LLTSRAESGPFSDTHVELLKTFADQAVIAVENVRLFTEIRDRTAQLGRSVDELTALGQVSQALSSTLELETVLTTLPGQNCLHDGHAGNVSSWLAEARDYPGRDRIDGGNEYQWDHAVARWTCSWLPAYRQSCRVELLKELLPKVSRIAVLVRATSPAAAQYVQEAEVAARTLGISLQVVTVREPRDLEGAFSAAHGASALLQSDDAVFTAHRIQIAELALKSRLPTVSGLREVVEAGGLMAYGAHTGELHRRAATYVDKILKGAKPADLPVEQPTKFELVINLKTAKALGLTIPPSLLARADRVIE
jgi:hypothetical protein